MPTEEEMPDTIARSPKEAQETWKKAHDSAVEQYGEGERAHRTAFSALKHKFQKVGDRWKPKGRKGPSDERAEQGSGSNKGESHGGVDVKGASKQQLYERAKELDVQDRSKMTKEELADAIARKQD